MLSWDNQFGNQSPSFELGALYQEAATSIDYELLGALYNENKISKTLEAS